MVIQIAVFNAILSFYGLYRAYKMKHMVIFIWLILSYYSITSIVSLCIPQNILFRETVRMTYVLNMLLCLTGFLLSDMIFNKHKEGTMDLSILKNRNLANEYTIIEFVYWISLIATFFELRRQDYTTYNTGIGAGWFQVLFQTTSCIIVRFIYNKQWVKISVSSVFVLVIVSVVGVRSLMYFILMPIGLYVLHYVISNVESSKKVLKLILPMIVISWAAAYVVNMLRFNESRLPETELTTISLSVIDRGAIIPQYMMSALHYITGLLTPIINVLNKFGIGIPDLSSYLLPSVPHLNAVVTYNVKDVDDLLNAAHMPATIYHDLWYCWGDYAIVAAFFLYWYLLKICAVFQRKSLLFFSFSGVFGWHFYMLLRGSVDTCSSGVAYSALLSFLLYFYLSHKISKYEQN